ncbi:MAG: hypothetical protein HY673_21300 [Chloroflexi bacterium]|nr:hypothetical protein [Chloroflexota bacterium]
MIWYIVKLKMQSASGTLWQADTIFGHLCWAVRYLDGEKALTEFLEWYREGMPPLLVSNGFPGDLLPRPLLPPPPAPTSGSLADQFKNFQFEKKRRATTYLRPDDFGAALRGEEPVLPDKDQNMVPGRRTTLKNQISRLTGTTGEEGRLFTFEEHFWNSVTIYLKVEPGFVDETKAAFEYLRDLGYGKRKSVGYGQIKSMTLGPFGGFGNPPGANGFVSLSNFVPASNDPIAGSWRPTVKYGKLSEGYAAEENVFKKPCLMLEAGSTFYDSPCREFYGRMVDGLSDNRPEVIQYGFALPLPIKLPAKA